MDFIFSEEFERQRIEQWNVLKEVGVNTEIIQPSFVLKIKSH